MKKGELRGVILELVRWIKATRVGLDQGELGMLERAEAAGKGKKRGRKEEEV